jgi:pilus assembly protein CpaB
MDKKKVMIMLGLMVVAIGTALAARSMLSGSPAPQVQAALPVIVLPKGPRVLVAQRSLQPGTIITNDAINFQEWPKDMVNGAYFVDGKTDMNKLLGTVVRFPITAGQPLTNGALVAPGDRGFLAAALGPGMRAVTITVSEKSGVAGFVFPGDHVDLMLTTAVKIPQNQTQGASADTRDLYATETILKNLRVLATDQSTEQETNNGKTIVHTFHNATLEVTPKIAEKIEVAQQGGALSLVLRSLADNQSDLDHAIANGSVKLPEGATKADEARALAGAKGNASSGSGSRATLMGGRLSDGAAIQPGSTFATAGDVSRFQRRGLPGSGPARASSGPQVHVMRGSESKDVDISSGPSNVRSPMLTNAAPDVPSGSAANPVN